jgi:hypothetical protein
MAQEFFPQRPKVDPRIYAYALPKVPGKECQPPRLANTLSRLSEAA